MGAAHSAKGSGFSRMTNGGHSTSRSIQRACRKMAAPSPHEVEEKWREDGLATNKSPTWSLFQTTCWTIGDRSLVLWRSFGRNTVVARSHIKLWLGHLVISNRTSRHREEQDGDVPAFIIGDRCFAWWSNEQLRRLTERKRRERDFACWYSEQLRRLD